MIIALFYMTKKALKKERDVQKEFTTESLSYEVYTIIQFIILNLKTD